MQVTASIEAPEWYEAQAGIYLEGVKALQAEVEAGTKQSYSRHEVWYPAGERIAVKVGRRTIEVDEGEARAYGVADVLEARGVSVNNVMSFRLFEGRNGTAYGIYGR